MQKNQAIWTKTVNKQILPEPKKSKIGNIKYLVFFSCNDNPKYQKTALQDNNCDFYAANNKKT